MTRVEAVAEVNARIGLWLIEAAITAADTSGNLKEPLDDALAAMGVARVNRPTAQPVDGDRFVLEAEYHTLRKVVRVLGRRFDLASEGDNLRLAQVRKHAEIDLADAAARLREVTGFWVGSLDLAFVAVETIDEFGAVA